jgi:hypothetical protein
MEPTMSRNGVEGSGRTPLRGVVRIDDGRIQAHLDEVVRSAVEEAQNALLKADWRSYRAGSNDPAGSDAGLQCSWG